MQFIETQQDSLSDEELIETLNVLIQGQYKVVHSGKIPQGKPDWFDKRKFEAGKILVEKYTGGIFFAHIISLTLLLYSPKVLKPLIFTKKSERPKKSYERYISTAIHVLSWYRNDIWNEDSPARKSLQYVRFAHSNVAGVCNSSREEVDETSIADCGKPLCLGKEPLYPIIKEDLTEIQDCPLLLLLDESYTKFDSSSSTPYFSQWDMSGTQFAFMGLIVLYPEKFGMARATEEELEGFIHMWRCFGWVLGIEDCYNYCQFDNLPKVRCWAQYSLRNLVIPWLKVSLTPEYEHMGRAVALGAKYYLGVSYETLYLFIAWVLDIRMPGLHRYASSGQHRAFRVYKFVFGFLGNLPLGNYLLNGLLYLNLKLIVDPPRFWPRRLRPPYIKGLTEYWKGTKVGKSPKQ